MGRIIPAVGVVGWQPDIAKTAQLNREATRLQVLTWGLRTCSRQTLDVAVLHHWYMGLVEVAGGLLKAST